MQLSQGVLFKQIAHACPKTIIILNNLLSPTSSIPSNFTRKIPAALPCSLSFSLLENLSGIITSPNKHQILNQLVQCVFRSSWNKQKLDRDSIVWFLCSLAYIFLFLERNGKQTNKQPGKESFIHLLVFCCNHLYRVWLIRFAVTYAQEVLPLNKDQENPTYQTIKCTHIKMQFKKSHGQLCFWGFSTQRYFSTT